jgi:hypothetical protein
MIVRGYYLNGFKVKLPKDKWGDFMSWMIKTGNPGVEKSESVGFEDGCIIFRKLM